MQHICVYEIRYSIFKAMFNALKAGGRISIQMGFGKYFVQSKDLPPTVGYYENNYDALTTNAGCDTRVEDAEFLKKDLYEIGFKDFEYWIRPTGPGVPNHPNWIFFTVVK